MDNPEKILEILNDKLWVEGEEHQIIGKIEAAKKIHEHYYPKEFVEWKDGNVGKTVTSTYWYVTTNFKTLDKLYNYWLTEIKNK